MEGYADDGVLSREPAALARTMSFYAAAQILGHANVERAMLSAREHVDEVGVIARHVFCSTPLAECAACWVPGTPACAAAGKPRNGSGGDETLSPSR